MMHKKISDYLTFARQCLGLLADEKLIFAVFILLSILCALTDGATIMLLVPILDTQGPGGGFAGIPLLSNVAALFAPFSASGRIEAVAVTMAAVLILRNLLQYAVDALGNVIPLRLERNFSRRAYAALMRVEISYIHQTEYGVLFSGIGNYPQWVTQMLNSVANILSNSFTLLVYVAMMLLVSWRMTALAVLFLLIMSLGLRQLSSGPLRRAGERRNLAATQFNQVIMETIAGMKVVRLSVAEAMMSAVYGRALDKLNVNQRRSVKIYAMIGPLLITATGIFICVLLFGSAILRPGDPTTWIGSVLIFLVLLFRLMTPVSNLNLMRSRVVNNLPSFNSLNAFYRETEGQPELSGSRQAGPLSQSVVLDRVGFGYKTENGPVIHDLSMTIERGKIVAIVGPSGAGKTTLIGLITRLYNPQKGRILVDGVDLRELDLHAWRKRLAIVAQDTFIFNDTAANNIAFGKDDVPMERIRTAAKLAVADEFIDQLPQGYDTVLGDRGVRLSGGQQQRISIARAILTDPDLLIFDEATSHLDTFTERAIQDAVERMSKDRTVLVIAHRLSTIRKADKVVVMDHGRIIEEGRHDELLARRGFYWEMVEHQRLDLVKEDGEVDVAIEARI